MIKQNPLKPAHTVKKELLAKRFDQWFFEGVDDIDNIANNPNIMSIKKRYNVKGNFSFELFIWFINYSPFTSTWKYYVLYAHTYTHTDTTHMYYFKMA